MNHSLRKAVYWTSTTIVCLIFLYSAWMYLTKYEMVVGFYIYLGFPQWMIYPLATLKILGVIAILYNRLRTVKEWAYAGFAFDSVAAICAHYMAGDGISALACIALIAVIVSRVTWPSMPKSY